MSARLPAGPAAFALRTQRAHTLPRLPRSPPPFLSPSPHPVAHKYVVGHC